MTMMTITNQIFQLDNLRLPPTFNDFQDIPDILFQPPPAISKQSTFNQSGPVRVPIFSQQQQKMLLIESEVLPLLPVNR